MEQSSVKEIWKDVVGYEGLYQVSNLGNIKSLDKYVNTRGKKLKLHKGKILKPKKRPRGYLEVSLYKDRKSKSIQIHRIVATAFIPNPENKPSINHINGNKKDNRVENLEWVTPEENMKHAQKSNLLYKGKRKIYCLEDNKIYESMQEVAKDFNVDYGQVKNACDNINNTLKNKHITYL